MASLPADEQLVLQALLSEELLTERALAQRFQLTRYSLRELLARAVSRLALQMCEGEPASGDARIAARIWIDGQPPRKVAQQLGLSTGEVQAAKNRFAQALLDSIRKGEKQAAKGE